VLSHAGALTDAKAAIVDPLLSRTLAAHRCASATHDVSRAVDLTEGWSRSSSHPTVPSILESAGPPH